MGDYQYIGQFEVPGGEEGTRRVLQAMRGLALQGQKDAAIRDAAEQLTHHLEQKDFRGEARVLSDFVRDNVRYVRDIYDVETLTVPSTTLERKFGDCDDKCILLSALLGAIGHPSRFVSIGFTPSNYSHVFVETKIGPKWVACETTEPRPFGWRPPSYRCFMLMHVNRK